MSMSRKLLSALIAAACLASTATTTSAGSTIQDPTHTQNFFGFNWMLYWKHARPFDKGMQSWIEKSMQWIYSIPPDQHPIPDPTGENCDVGQEGPVWYLAPIGSSEPGSYTRTCTIPRDKAILLIVGFISDIYPCPDPSFEPAPGQSMYDFLIEDVQALSDAFLDFASLEVTLDGWPVHRELRYHYLSDNLYALKGDLSLQPVFDSCITGDWQPAVFDGYFMMFRPLSPGPHTIVRTSVGAESGATNTFTYYLNVE